MNIKIVTETNIREYMSILTSDEIYGISDGRTTSFVVTDDDKEEPVGVMTVQILPEFIRLERIFILPEYRRRGLAAGLLDVVKERPEEARLPIRAFLEGEEDVRGLLEASGFTKTECDYSVIMARLGDWKDVEIKKKKGDGDSKDRGVEFCRLDQVSVKMVRNFILSSPFDEVIQFPDKTLDLERFSDISSVCLKNNTVIAAALVEETEEYSQFTWVYGKDMQAVLVCMSMVKNELLSEYDPDYMIRCLCPSQNVELGYKQFFSKYDSRKTDSYQFI